MKFKVAYRYRLKQDLQFLGIVILVEIALGMLGIVLQSLTTPVTMTSLTNRLQQAHPDFYFVVAIFAMGALVYQGYSLFMQNGLSRRTYWLSKVASLSTIALLASLIAVMYRAFVAIPLGATSYAAVGKTLFGSAAGSGIQPLLWQWGRSLSVLLLVMAAGMVFGSVMSLFAWRGKMVLMIAGGATGLAMLTLLAKAMTGIDTSYMDTWVGPIVRLMFGFHGTHGMQYPGNLIVTNLVFAGLGLAISYGFNQLLRLRRG